MNDINWAVQRWKGTVLMSLYLPNTHLSLPSQLHKQEHQQKNHRDDHHVHQHNWDDVLWISPVAVERTVSLLPTEIYWIYERLFAIPEQQTTYPTLYSVPPLSSHTIYYWTTCSHRLYYLWYSKCRTLEHDCLEFSLHAAVAHPHISLTSCSKSSSRSWLV